MDLFHPQLQDEGQTQEGAGSQETQETQETQSVCIFREDTS